MGPRGDDPPGSEADLTVEPLLALAADLVSSAPYGFVVTAGRDGRGPRARLVQRIPTRRLDPFTIRFGTSPRSRKIADIAAEPRVAYAVEVRDRFATVVCAGTATVHEDLDSRRECWIDGFAAFFPAGPEGDDYVVVDIATDRLEILDFGLGVAPEPYGLVPAVLVRDGAGPWSPEPPERSG